MKCLVCGCHGFDYLIVQWQLFGKGNRWQANLNQLIPCISENEKMDYSSIVEADVAKKLKNFVTNQRKNYVAPREQE